MGQVTSRPDEPAALYLRDQTRLSIAALSVTNSRRRVVLNVAPNAFPATKIAASRDIGDSSVIEYVQDPEATSSSSAPNFILKLNSEEELTFNFTLIIRQAQQAQSNVAGNNAPSTTTPVDTFVNGLTFVAASNAKQVDHLTTTEFHADPNLHNHENVHLMGDYNTDGSSSVSFYFSWKWKPPKPQEDRGGGWRNTCSFVEYDARAHRLVPMATFSFWVSNLQQYYNAPTSPSPPFALHAPPKLRVPSSQSVDSRISNAESRDMDRPISPSGLALDVPFHVDPIKVDVSCQRPGEDISAGEDGPVFRATMKALEQKTSNFRAKMKKVLRKAEAAHQAQIESNDATKGFMDALREASSSNANAVQPAIEHYFDKIAREILQYEKQNAMNLQKIIIDPLSKVYQNDIKQAESKKRDFEEESKDYYQYVSRYLGQRQDSMKEKKRADADSKYQVKRRNFELKRFDYSSFMQDLHGGRKELEVLSYLTKYADAQTKCYLTAGKKVEELLPPLEALSTEVKEADKQYQFQRTEREEKRRLLERSASTYNEPDSMPPGSAMSQVYGSSTSDTEATRSDSTASQMRSMSANGTSGSGQTIQTDLSRAHGSLQGGNPVTSPSNNSKFKGIRDLEEKDHSQGGVADKNGTQRKEGLLWALSRPGSHADPKGLNKQAWHKFWIVVDQGKVSEYSNWKQKLDLHMEPIDLRMASVRQARDADRRFCFEVITPQFKRVYQATSEDDMNSWISAINNALQSAMEGRGLKDLPAPKTQEPSSLRRDIGSILTGKSISVNHGHHSKQESMSAALTSPGGVFRRTTVGARPAYGRSASSNFEESPDKLLQLLRDTDQGNMWCADCGSGVKTEWVSINLAIIVCIECSGIHRSLGTHISKMRSLTLDINSFTTDIVELLLLVGNRVANMIWEAKLDMSQKPTPQASRDQRLRFITAKYVERAYIDTAPSRYGTPDDTLLSAIKRNDVQQVIFALASRANPNTPDKVRSTPPVYLALAAADPAAPSSGPDTSPATAPTKPIPFPIAELLVQNGAEIPLTPPPFPLSPAAKLYIDQKSGRAPATNDLVGSLPVGGRMADRTGADFSKDARMQKRVSAGGRLAKAVIPERG